MKKICKQVTDVLVSKMNEAVESYNACHKHAITTDNKVCVARVVLGKRVKSSLKEEQVKYRFANPAGVPVLCFLKKASSNKTIIVGIESGKVDIVGNALISIKHKNMETFRLCGIRYKIKNFLNGVPIFAAIRHKTDNKAVDSEFYDVQATLDHWYTD